MEVINMNIVIERRRSVVQIERDLQDVKLKVKKVKDRDDNYTLGTLYLTYIVIGCFAYMLFKGMYGITPNIFLMMSLLVIVIGFLGLTILENKLNTLEHRYNKVRKMQLERELKIARSGKLV